VGEALLNVSTQEYETQRRSFIRHLTRKGVPKTDAEDMFQTAWYRLCRGVAIGKFVITEEKGTGPLLACIANFVYREYKRAFVRGPEVLSVGEWLPESRPLQLASDAPEPKRRGAYKARKPRNQEDR
jgi:hypothetical protein